jgi:signal transduction histidine kinase
VLSYRRALRRTVTLGPPAISAAAVAICLGLTVLAVKTPWSTLPRPVIAASGLVAGAAVWFRGRWPVTVAAVGAGAYALSGNPGPLLISLFSGAGAGGVRAGWRFLLLAAIGVAGFLAPGWVGNDQASVGSWLFATVLTAVLMASGGYAATRRELTKSLRERAERAEAEQRLRNEQARAAERARIAREMHDVLAHKVTLISLHAGGLEVNAHAEPARIEQGAALIRATAQDALEELRTILGVLRGEGGNGAGGARDSFDESPDVDLRRLVESWVRAGSDITLHGDVDTMPAATARAAYRFVQEGLTNAHKHAPGAPVTVSVAGRPGDDVTITVANERPRLRDPQLPDAGVGLVGLAERFRLIGGTVRSGPDNAGGWLLEGRLPWLADATDPSAGESRDQDTAGGR